MLLSLVRITRSSTGVTATARNRGIVGWVPFVDRVCCRRSFIDAGVAHGACSSVVTYFKDFLALVQENNPTEYLTVSKHNVGVAARCGLTEHTQRSPLFRDLMPKPPAWCQRWKKQRPRVARIDAPPAKHARRLSSNGSRVWVVWFRLGTITAAL